eukprot:PhM_4_TR14227/c0_g2_i2/m.66647
MSLLAAWTLWGFISISSSHPLRDRLYPEERKQQQSIKKKIDRGTNNNKHQRNNKKCGLQSCGTPYCTPAAPRGSFFREVCLFVRSVSDISSGLPQPRGPWG